MQYYELSQNRILSLLCNVDICITIRTGNSNIELGVI